MTTTRRNNEGVSRFFLQGGATLVMSISLLACGGGGGSDGPAPNPGGNGDEPAVEAFTEPEDAVLHAAVLLVTQGRLTDASRLLAPVCEDGGTVDSESVAIPTPFGASDLDGTRWSYQECVNSDEALDGRLEIAADADGSITYSGFGAEGAPLTRTNVDTGATALYAGQTHVCGDSCNLVNGVPTWDMRTTLSVAFRDEEGDLILESKRGTESEPFQQRWRDDYPNAGERLFWVDGALSYQGALSEAGGSCLLRQAHYSVPEPSRFLVLAGESADYPTESGLVRIELGGTVADAEYAPGGITLTVDGVAETFTWQRVEEAFDTAGCPVFITEE